MKKFLYTVFVVILFACSFFGRVLINSCNSYFVGNKVQKSEVEEGEFKPMEVIDDVVGRMNKICPIHFELWADISNLKINKKGLDVKITISDDAIDTYDKKIIILEILQQFGYECKDIEKLNKAMEEVKMNVNLIICRSNGEIKETISMEPKEFFLSPIIENVENEYNPSLEKDKR